MMRQGDLFEAPVVTKPGAYCGACGGDGRGRPLQVMAGQTLICLDCYALKLGALTVELGDPGAAMLKLNEGRDGTTYADLMKAWRKQAEVK